MLSSLKILILLKQVKTDFKKGGGIVDIIW